MQFDIEQQTLTLEGHKYTREELICMAEKMPENLSPFMQEVYQFLAEWFSPSPYMTVHTSGSTGTPKEWNASKEKMMQSARMTCEALHLREGDSALLCMSLRYIAGKMMVVRALVNGLNLIVRTPSGHPLADVKQPIRFAAMVPLQVYNTMDTPLEKKRLAKVEILIIGGGMINPHYMRLLYDMPGEIYATYGMTETLSHVGLCRLNGNNTDTVTYYPLPGVKLSLSKDETLVIEAPAICDEVLTTNDVVDIDSEGGFIILGRADNTINTGGVKVQPERVEGFIQNVLPLPFAITSVPDDLLGEAVTLLVQGMVNIEQIRELTRSAVTRYSAPKWIFSVDKIPLTGNGKIDRAACKKLACRYFEGMLQS